MFIHGGRDHEQGSFDTMWRVDLGKIKLLKEDSSQNIEWEPVKFKGNSPGRISHHTAHVIEDSPDVIIYGGIKGDESNPDVYNFNVDTFTWSKLQFNSDGNAAPRDDHCMSAIGSDEFAVFGGFVDGSRTNDVLSFNINGGKVQGKCVEKNDEESKDVPPPRAGHDSVFYNDKLIIYGGQDSDHCKLGDLWEFDFAKS